MFELVKFDPDSQNAVIKVLGIGGGGGNVIQHMLSRKIEGVEFICADTDAQALKKRSARTVIQFGANVTKGFGAGADPEKGRQAALEDRDRFMDVMKGADMVFITGGMGGGTGTGAAPIAAQVAKEMGILTVAVVTRPFGFEGKKRAEIASEGIRQLSQYVDSLITIPNELFALDSRRDSSVLEAFKRANDVLLGAIQGIADLITRPGYINVDFADVRTVMAEMGMAMMGTGTGTGQDRARVAAESAIASPLLEDVHLSGAKGILVNITAGDDLRMGEFEEVGNIVKAVASEHAPIVVGTVVDQSLSDAVRVTVVAAGLSCDPLAAVPTLAAIAGCPGATGRLPDDLLLLVPIEEDSIARPRVQIERDDGLPFMRAEAGDINSICLLVPAHIPLNTLVRLILDLSNVYKSVGGDELVVENVTEIFPKSARRSPRLRRRGFG